MHQHTEWYDVLLLLHQVGGLTDGRASPSLPTYRRRLELPATLPLFVMLQILNCLNTTYVFRTPCPSIAIVLALHFCSTLPSLVNNNFTPFSRFAATAQNCL